MSGYSKKRPLLCPPALTYLPIARESYVLWALTRFTSEFGMGSGGTDVAQKTGRHKSGRNETLVVRH